MDQATVDAITAGVDFTTTQAGMAVIGASVIGVIVTLFALKKMYRAISG